MLNCLKKQKRLLLQQALFLCLTIFIYCWVSLPGLSGGFILDDWPNLDRLSQVKSFNDLWGFTFSGISGSPGRPLAYLSFALQAEHWPINPFPFKLTNLCIHIINALQVYLSCLLLSRILGWTRHSRMFFSGMVFCLWLFLPLHISSVFYVIQRMTLMAGFFTLFGINTFLAGLLYAEENTKKGIFLATGGMGIAYIAGILCKENAILVGLYISTLYFILLREQKKSILWDGWVLLCGVLPSLIVFLYLFFSNRYLSGYSIRHFTQSERLLTESIIVWDYVRKILLPTPTNLNIFNDGFPLSRSLTAPLTTLLAISGWFIMLFLAIVIRKKNAFFSFAILWFIVGHLLESTFLGLELYFEHRNYTPSLGILMGISGLIITQWQKINTANTRLKKIIFSLAPATICCWFILISSIEIQSWRSPATLAISALNDRPNSLRARQEAAASFANSKDFPKAAFLLATIEQEWPGYPGNYAQMLMLKCLDNQVITPDINEISIRFRTGKFDRGTSDAMHQMLLLKKQGHCNYLTWMDYRSLLNNLLSNSIFSSFNDNFIVLMAYSYNAQKNFKMAAEILEKLPEVKADINFMILKAKFNAMAGNDQIALLILNKLRNRYQDDFKIWPANRRRVEQLKQQIDHKPARTY